MEILFFVLLLLAAVCFLSAAFAWRAPNPHPIYGYPSMVALGLLLWVLVPLIRAAKAL